MLTRVLILVFLSVSSASTVAQKAFRDVDFSDTCKVVEEKMLAYGDTTLIDSCEEGFNFWLSFELDKLFYHEALEVTFIYNSRDNGELSSVEIYAAGITMIFIGEAKDTLTQVHGVPVYENPRYYSLSTLALPDPDIGGTHRVLYRWLSAEGVSIELWAGVLHARSEDGVSSSIRIRRPKEDAWQF